MSLTGLISPHLSACPKPGLELPVTYVVVFVVFSESI